jgi:hypothetical protein
MIYIIDNGCSEDICFKIDDVEFHLENDYAGVAEVYVRCDYETEDADMDLFEADWNAEELRFMAYAFNQMADKLEKYI